jgi:hypothetical protein
MVDTNERPFQCPQCSSTFGRLDTLLRHERTLHGSSTTAASNNPAHHRSTSISAGKPKIKRNNSTASQSALANNPLQSQLDPQLTTLSGPSPTIPGLSPIHHHPQSPGLILNGTNFSPQSHILSNLSPALINPTLTHTTPHKSAFSPLVESPALWESFSSLDPMNTSLSFTDIQSQFSKLLFPLLPSGPSVPPTPGPVPQTPAQVVHTPNLDSFIHSPSPMSFPLSSERGLVVPSHTTVQQAAISSPTNSSASYPPGSKTSFLRSLEDFDRGVLESEIRKCDGDITYTRFDSKFELPKKDALNRYLCAYFEGMHQHHPFIHTATFDPVSIKGIPPE